MKLEMIALGNLSVSKSNMRYARKAPDVSDILPTVRARGVLQSLIVRPSQEPGHAQGHYEVVAGFRRFHAAGLVAAERQCAHAEAGEAGETGAEEVMVPCAILDDADDASAVEASLIENMARLDPDEVSRWACFVRLVKEGRGIGEISRTFGLPELAVRRILALGNLLPRIREMYRAEQIDAATVRHLTLASKGQQKAWLALMDDTGAYAPRGHQPKTWLFGGQSVPSSHALFDIEASGLALVADLFGEEAYFAESDAFWDLQNAAVAARRLDFIETGWSDAVVLPPDVHFHSWEHSKTPKRKGGRVYLDVRGSGEVVIHEGYLPSREAARLSNSEAGGEGGAAPTRAVRPELTSVTQTYVDLHRHAATRAELLGRPDIALRLMVAHVIAGSALWRITAEPQKSRNDAIRQSVGDCRGEAVFHARRREVLALLDLPDDEPTVIAAGYGLRGGLRGVCDLFARLMALPDDKVLEVLTLVMGEALEAGSPAVEAAGLAIGVTMADWWEADDAFLETLRDREVLLAMVEDVAGKTVAEANALEKAKTLRTIIRSHLSGSDGRNRVAGWVPRWMTFPPSAYTLRGGVGTVEAHAHACAAIRPEEEPEEAGTGKADKDGAGIAEGEVGEPDGEADAQSEDQTDGARAQDRDSRDQQRAA